MSLAGPGRRALARTVDAIGSAVVPAGVVTLLYMKEPAALTGGLVVWLGLGWGCLLLLLFSFLEGSWGITPGKWLLGVRVVRHDLGPCGFGRALLRNLALLVDALADFLVGVLIIALSARWQRLGDMLADTVVVRRPPEATPRRAPPRAP